MYKIIFATSILCLVLISASAQRGVRIAYVDMDYILENIEEYQLAMKQLAVKTDNWKRDIEIKEQEIKKLRENLNFEKILLTKELIEEREQEILFYQKQLYQYQQDRFGTNGDYIIQQKKIIQPIQDKIFNVLNDVAIAKNYDFIFDKSADVVMLYSNKRFDISDQVIKMLKNASLGFKPQKVIDSVKNKK